MNNLHRVCRVVKTLRPVCIFKTRTNEVKYKFYAFHNVHETRQYQPAFDRQRHTYTRGYPTGLTKREERG